MTTSSVPSGGDRILQLKTAFQQAESAITKGQKDVEDVNDLETLATQAFKSINLNAQESRSLKQLGFKSPHEFITHKIDHLKTVALFKQLSEVKDINKVLARLDAENEKIAKKIENLSPAEREFYVSQAQTLLNQRRMSAQQPGKHTALHDRVQSMHAKLDAIRTGKKDEIVKETARAKFPHAG